MHITAKISSGRAKCRWYHKGKWCTRGDGLDPNIPKGEPVIMVEGDSAGGPATLTLCKKHAPAFLKECRKAELEFDRLMKVYRSVT